MTTHAALERRMRCHKFDPVRCDFHVALFQMHDTAKQGKWLEYKIALEKARRAAGRREGLLPLSKAARAERLALVKQADNAFLASFGSAAKKPMDKIEAALDAAYAEQSAFDRIQVQAAYFDPDLGREVDGFHPFGETLEASLLGSKPQNQAHAFVMHMVLEALVDQRNVVAADAGIIQEPTSKTFENLGVPLHEVSPECGDDDGPGSKAYEMRFNQGWLYAFMEAVIAARDGNFASYEPDSEHTDIVALKEFVHGRQLYWAKMWQEHGVSPDVPARQKAFFDGAVTAWDNWIESL